MESFFQWISFLDYYENDKRESTVGYVLWKIKKEECSIEIKVGNIEINDCTLIIREENTGVEIGEIDIVKECGEYRDKFIVDKQKKIILSGGKIINLQDLKKINMVIDEKRKLSAKINIELIDNQEQIQDIKIDNDLRKEDKKIERKKENLTVCIKGKEENKWEKLCRSYPNVYPFKQRQRFISIHPKDFIILAESYQSLAGNSFLLHGYYQYGEMILGKLDNEEEAPYYIGVPGIFLEREKKSASLFGFVGFEPLDEEIIQGSRGYYMTEVKL